MKKTLSPALVGALALCAASAFAADLPSAKAPLFQQNRALTDALLYASAYRSSTRFKGDIIRAGLNYPFRRFAPAPLVAKY